MPNVNWGSFIAGAILALLAYQILMRRKVAS